MVTINNEDREEVRKVVLDTIQHAKITDVYCNNAVAAVAMKRWLFKKGLWEEYTNDKEFHDAIKKMIKTVREEQGIEG